MTTRAEIIIDLTACIERLSVGIRRALGPQERFFFAEALRDCADTIEHEIASDCSDAWRRHRSN
jgi:hypothetical protein